MKRYLFLLAWLEGSDSAGGDLTGINKTDDLYPQFVAGNDYILAVDIIAPNDEIAMAFGFWTAFRNNYTALDSCSDLIERGQARSQSLNSDDRPIHKNSPILTHNKH
jgi:hypothetical protein